MTAWLFVIPKNPIAVVMRIPQEQTIAASAIAAVIVFSGLLFRSFGRDKTKYGK